MYFSWAPVAHTCNPSYSGCRDQEDHGLKPALGKQLARPPHLEKKKNIQKQVGGVAQAVKSACLASMRPRDQNHNADKKKKKDVLYSTIPGRQSAKWETV
jgi:hypothetical protein